MRRLAALLRRELGNCKLGVSVQIDSFFPQRYNRRAFWAASSAGASIPFTFAALRIFSLTASQTGRRTSQRSCESSSLQPLRAEPLGGRAALGELTPPTRPFGIGKCRPYFSATSTLFSRS